LLNTSEKGHYIGPFGAPRGNFDFGRSKNAAFYEKTRIVRCKNAFLRYENCVLEFEIAKKCKKNAKKPVFLEIRRKYWWIWKCGKKC